ncbi:MAG: DUF4286 family protein [Cyclobacteriaceae bacterium]|nr:DUF4286 family protein [Cyclobacteriaceae bacterium]
MILYNVTIGIDKGVEQDWLAWMKKTHVPEVLDTGFFVDHKIFKVLSQQEGDNPSYSIQYFAKSIADIDNYLQNHAPKLQQDLLLRYKDKHVAFRTLLESV